MEQAGLALELSPVRARQVVAPPAAYDAVVLLARRRSVPGPLFHYGIITAIVLMHCQLLMLPLPVA